MMENLQHGIRVKDIADHANCALRSLERRFKNETGKTMLEELARLRLERATRLLLQTDYPLKRVASECGYSSPSYFNQAFSRAMGMTPRDFRLSESGRH
jgi:LacI family transcriptional regulator